jgi:hypothetical protein
MSNEVKIKGFDGGEEGCIFRVSLLLKRSKNSRGKKQKKFVNGNWDEMFLIYKIKRMPHLDSK